ncbi:GGDEF domain-containing phosphodiesterase [Rhizobium sp. MHM7A]|uniref:putative bifunctional diguanylate cyclase/phosphodiesterase n=1 Tax=Rhizobium sp. MHM7A TaxID=2583233 RepID=UPI001485D1E5|nr:GGDEF domain-containing phosphodiesterase [Rhizobium sp. MHM7A]
MVGVSGIALWIGAFELYSVLFHGFQVPVYLAIGVAFGTLTSTIGRNLGAKKLTWTFLILGVIPLAIAIFAVGVIEENYWYCSVAVVFLPFGMVAKTAAQEVTDLVETNYHNRLEAEDLSVALNLALNYQPTGMMMLDGEGRVALLNQTGRHMLKLPLAGDEDELVGAPFEFLFDTVRKRYGVTVEDFEPLRIKLRGLLGGLEDKTTIRTPEGRHFEFRVNHLSDVDQGNPLQGAVIVFTDITSQVENASVMARLANMDTLTQTPNRRHWNSLVEASSSKIRLGERIAICVLDINQLKLINDTMSQMAGDAAIKQIADKLNEIEFETIIGRYGGDEFVIAIPGIKSTDDIAVKLDTIFNKINTNYIVHGHSIDIKVSGGVYVHKSGRFVLTEAFSRADHALRKVKGMPTRAWTEFTRSMEMEYQRTLQIKAALREEISENSLKMMYQPMFLPDGSAFDCCEALARWVHPELGEVGPAEFIEIAEEIGVIQMVTRAILMKACKDCATWPANATVSVNFSTLDVAHPEVLGMVRSCLTESGLDPRRLQIEVTETVFVNDFHNMSRTLKSLQQLGVRIALDDFGTGYSALSYLTKLNFDKVKIDRSFIINVAHDLQSQLLFNGIVALSKSMKFDVVVEGVETQEQLHAVTATGEVDRIQGFIYSRPQTSEDIIERLTDGDPPPTPSKLVTFETFRKGRRA